MLIRCGYDIAYECTADTPLLAMLHVRPERHINLMTPEAFAVLPYVPYRTYVDGFGNVCTRMVLPPGTTHLTCDFTIWDSGVPDYIPYGAPQVPVDQLPHDVLVYLLGSRYCETDKLSQTAWDLFGNTPPGWGRVQAVCDFVHQHIKFDYQQARSTRSAFDAFEERIGVCRDFAHLAVALCRCLNIPARYVNGHLGDIGVPVVDPMDFSAWIEVFLEGSWWTFDPRNNMPRIGRIVVARGRDAADIPLINSFGPHVLNSFRVWTYEVTEQQMTSNV